MKNALWLAGYCILSGCGIATAQTAAAPAKPAPVPPATNPTTGGAIANSADPMEKPVVSLPALFAPTVLADPSDIPTIDPEAVAAQTLAVVRAREQTENSEDEIAAEAQQQKAEQEQHDWMLRDYQERLRKRGLEKAPANGTDADGNPTTKMSDDTEATPANGPAADPLLDSVLAMDKPAVKRGPADLAAGASDPNQKTEPGGLLGGFLQPLLPPLASSANSAAPAHDYFGGVFAPDQTAETERPDKSDTTAPAKDDAILDVPGMTAAQQGGLIDPSLSLDDRLPDETGPSRAPHVDENDDKLPTMPLNDIAAFYKKQAADLAPPTVPGLQAPPVVLTLPKTYQPPPPTAKPAIDGLRNHVADPFDFLNR